MDINLSKLLELVMGREAWSTQASQSIGASALASVFPMNIQGWYPLGLTGFISLQSKGLSRVVWINVSYKDYYEHEKLQGVGL